MMVAGTEATHASLDISETVGPPCHALRFDHRQSSADALMGCPVSFKPCGTSVGEDYGGVKVRLEVGPGEAVAAILEALPGLPGHVHPSPVNLQILQRPPTTSRTSRQRRAAGSFSGGVPVGEYLAAREGRLAAGLPVLEEDHCPGIDVTCGDPRPGGMGKRGRLMVPLASAAGKPLVECLCQDCLLTGELMSPVRFEAHCGRAAAKKWKQSIRTVGVGLPSAPESVAARVGLSTQVQPPSTRPTKSPKSSRQALETTGGHIPPLQPPPSVEYANNSTVEFTQPVHSGSLSLALPDRAAERKERKRKRARVMKEGQLAIVVYGACEEALWARRLWHFIETMRGVLGNRQFDVPWGGSVVDSVIGTFLTQNVSDTLSSTAYMTLTSTFPLPNKGEASPCTHPEGTMVRHQQHSADWLAVRTDQAGHVAEAIRCRGMNIMLAARIKRFVERVMLEQASRKLEPVVGDCTTRFSRLGLAQEEKDQAQQLVPEINSLQGPQVQAAPVCRCGKAHCSGDLCLEWLRSMPAEKASSYLASCGGLGRKSCACISLLCLGHKDFPVDVNVGRISARLGWIPLESEAGIEELDEYAPEPAVHAFLRTRLLGIMSLEQLYELHYQMITLGKVFCSKRMPNCRACPLRNSCEYALAGGPCMGGTDTGNQPPVQHQVTHCTGVDGRALSRECVGSPSSEPAGDAPEGRVTATVLSICSADSCSLSVQALVEAMLAASRPMYSDDTTWKEKLQAGLEVIAAGTLPTSHSARATRASGGSVPIRHERKSPIDNGPDPDGRDGSTAAAPSLSAKPLTVRGAPVLHKPPPSDELTSLNSIPILHSTAAPTAPGGLPLGSGSWQSPPPAQAAPSFPAAAAVTPDGLIHSCHTLAAEAGICLTMQDLPATAYPATPLPACASTEQAEPSWLSCGPGTTGSASPEPTLSPTTPTKGEAVRPAVSPGGSPTASQCPAHEWGPPAPEAASLPPAQAPQAAVAALRRRYHSLSRLVHPDKCLIAGSPHAFASLHKAYTIVSTSLDLRAEVLQAPVSAVTTVPAGDGIATPLVIGSPLRGRSGRAAGGEVPLSTEDIGCGEQLSPAGDFERLWDPELEGNRFRRRMTAFEVDEASLLAAAPWVAPPRVDDPSPVLAFARWAEGCRGKGNAGGGGHGVAERSAEHCGQAGGGSADREAGRLAVTLLVPCRRALHGRFPLNGTFFQVNELFADHKSMEEPVLLPSSSLKAQSPTKVYTGISVPSICRGMGTPEVAELFTQMAICIRAMDSASGAPRPLPEWMLPARTTKSSSAMRRSANKAAAGLGGQRAPLAAIVPGILLDGEVCHVSHGEAQPISDSDEEQRAFRHQRPWTHNPKVAPTGASHGLPPAKKRPLPGAATLAADTFPSSAIPAQPNGGANVQSAEIESHEQETHFGSTPEACAIASGPVTALMTARSGTEREAGHGSVASSLFLPAAAIDEEVGGGGGGPVTPHSLMLLGGGSGTMATERNGGGPLAEAELMGRYVPPPTSVDGVADLVKCVAMHQWTMYLQALSQPPGCVAAPAAPRTHSHPDMCLDIDAGVQSALHAPLPHGASLAGCAPLLGSLQTPCGPSSFLCPQGASLAMCPPVSGSVRPPDLPPGGPSSRSCPQGALLFSQPLSEAYAGAPSLPPGGPHSHPCPQGASLFSLPLSQGGAGASGLLPGRLSCTSPSGASQVRSPSMDSRIGVAAPSAAAVDSLESDRDATVGGPPPPHIPVTAASPGRQAAMGPTAAAGPPLTRPILAPRWNAGVVGASSGLGFPQRLFAAYPESSGTMKCAGRWPFLWTVVPRRLRSAGPRRPRHPSRLLKGLLQALGQMIPSAGAWDGLLSCEGVPAGLHCHSGKAAAEVPPPEVEAPHGVPGSKEPRSEANAAPPQAPVRQAEPPAAAVTQQADSELGTGAVCEESRPPPAAIPNRRCSLRLMLAPRSSDSARPLPTTEVPILPGSAIAEEASGSALPHNRHKRSGRQRARKTSVHRVPAKAESVRATGSGQQTLVGGRGVKKCGRQKSQRGSIEALEMYDVCAAAQTPAVDVNLTTSFLSRGKGTLQSIPPRPPPAPPPPPPPLPEQGQENRTPQGRTGSSEAVLQADITPQPHPDEPPLPVRRSRRKGGLSVTTSPLAPPPPPRPEGTQKLMLQLPKGGSAPPKTRLRSAAMAQPSPAKTLQQRSSSRQKEPPPSPLPCQEDPLVQHRSARAASSRKRQLAEVDVQSQRSRAQSLRQRRQTEKVSKEPMARPHSRLGSRNLGSATGAAKKKRHMGCQRGSGSVRVAQSALQTVRKAQATASLVDGGGPSLADRGSAKLPAGRSDRLLDYLSSASALAEAAGKDIVWGKLKHLPWLPAHVTTLAASNAGELQVQFFGTVGGTRLRERQIKPWAEGAQEGFLSKSLHFGFLAALQQAAEFIAPGAATKGHRAGQRPAAAATARPRLGRTTRAQRAAERAAAGEG